MVRTLILTLFIVVAMAAPHAQDKANVAGTWDVNLMSHQMALVLEQEGAAVTGTLMIMGKDVPVDGEFVDGKLSLTGKGALMARGSQDGEKMPITLTATMKDDGTLEGEMPMGEQTAKWTAERLKKRK